MAGTHGDPDSRLSGLTDIDLLVHDFYVEDCERVGVKAGPRRLKSRGLPVRTWDRLPTINKPAVKIEPPPPGSFYADEDLQQMDIRLGNMSYYYNHQQKLVDDIKEVKNIKNLKRNSLI